MPLLAVKQALVSAGVAKSKVSARHDAYCAWLAEADQALARNSFVFLLRLHLQSPPPGYDAPTVPYDSADEGDSGEYYYEEVFDSEDYEEEMDSSDDEGLDPELYPNLKRRGRFVMMDQPYRSE